MHFNSGESSNADVGAQVLAKGLIKVVLESDQAHTGDIRRSQHNVFKIEDDWTVCDLLLQIAKKRSAVRLLSEQMYELRLSEDDIDQHHFWSEESHEPDGVLPLHLLLSSLDVQPLHLHRKKFSDEGLVKVNKAARGAAGHKRSEYTSAAAEMKSDEEALNKYYLRYTEIQVRCIFGGIRLFKRGARYPLSQPSCRIHRPCICLIPTAWNPSPYTGKTVGRVDSD